jgi:CarboxypepD_reg-like domain
MNAPVQKLKYLFALLLLISFSRLKAQETYTIKGTVRDDTGPLPGATVFLTGTKAITACDNDGMFHLDHISPGQYVLVAKMIGFEPLSMPVVVKNHAVQLGLVLKTNTNKLKEVTITGDNNWDEHYREFKKWFLGTTPNAGDCDILNPKVLFFHYDKQSLTLTASADEFLIVQNKALGYRIKYLLTNFEHDNINNIVKYQGYPSFEDMVAKTENEAARWKKNRQTAYNGSIINFMKAIYNDKVYEAGFEIYKLIHKPPIGTKYNNENRMTFDDRQVMTDSLVTPAADNLKNFSFKDALFVVYTKERNPAGFENSGFKIERPARAKFPNGQMSMVTLMESSITIDVQGNYSPTNGLLFEGFMGWEQIADLTPLEFGKEE